jgi:redox-sensitive bicupin YhaK (pirin superfamily)
VTLRTIDRVHGVRHLGGDGQVDRKAIVIPPGNWDLFDPFLMLAEDWFSAPGFDWHPHRGIETVTTVLDGALEHGDNRGNAGVLGPGDVQWMTAGGGIVHRELAHRDERAHTLQLWVNLPSSHKLVEARYQDFTPDAMGLVETPGTRVQVVSGAGGPARNHWPITGLRVTVEPGRSVELMLPAVDRAFLYVLGGHVVAGADRYGLVAGDVAWSDPVGDGDRGSTLTLDAPEGDEVVEAILYSGRPIRESVVARGPFVMNSTDEIEQAFRDFRSGLFGDVPILARL